jgi:hypothetical protein
MKLVGIENNAYFSNCYFPSKIQNGIQVEMPKFCDEN